MDKAHTIHATWTTSYVQLYLVAGIAAAVAVVAFLLFWRKHKSSPTLTKPPPPTVTPMDKTGTDVAPAPPSEAPANKAEIVCTSCGTANPIGTLFCTECGAQLS